MPGKTETKKGKSKIARNLRNQWYKDGDTHRYAIVRWDRKFGNAPVPTLWFFREAVAPGTPAFRSRDRRKVSCPYHSSINSEGKMHPVGVLIHGTQTGCV